MPECVCIFISAAVYLPSAARVRDCLRGFGFESWWRRRIWSAGDDDDGALAGRNNNSSSQ